MESEPAKLRALREAVRIAPDDPTLRRLLADALLEAGDPVAALAEYRHCLAAQPHDGGLLLAIAGAYRAASKPQAGLEAIEDLLVRAGDSAPALLLQARLYDDLGRSAEAAAAYGAAVQADPRAADLEFATRLGLKSAIPTELPAIGGAARPVQPVERRPEESTPSTVPPEVPVGAERGQRSPDGAGGPREPVPAEVEGVPTDLALNVERPRVTFADVGGMDPVKEEIRLKIIHPAAHPELYAAYGKSAGGGILLYGPPGCGKTHLARATAGEVRSAFIAVGISEVLEMWFGQSERNLHAVFDGARAHRPSVLFFDEVDALAARRSDFHGTTGRNVVNVFLAELDGLEGSNDGVLVLAATNAPWHLDPAFRRPGRFDRIIFVPPPDAAARAEILRVMLAGKPTADIDHADVARKTDHFSGADLKGLVDVAIEAKLGQAIRDGIPTPLTTKDLVTAAKTLVPSTREWFATARNYVLYANESGLYDAVRPYLKL
jgi:AAA+ superfamily predicted ATPase